MKAKVVGVASSLLFIGLGIVINVLADKWGWWVGLSLIGLGLIGLILGILWNKLRYLVDAEYRRWKRLPSGTIISKTEKKTESEAVPKITKEVKKL
jgi:hypothetical protein